MSGLGFEFEGPPPESLDDLLDMVGTQMKKLAKGKGKRNVLKRYPMRPEWQELYKACTDAAKEATSAHGKVEHAKKRMWVKIEADLGIFDRNLHWNAEDRHVEVEADERDEGDS